MRSPLYWHPVIYQIFMRLLYGTHFQDRYKAIADLIPSFSDVMELCMGDGYLYRNYLRQKKVKYLGLDINETFVRQAGRRGITARIHDLITDPLPSHDYLILQGSLYQFIPHESQIVQKALNASRRMLVVAEPVKNLSSGRNRVVSLIAAYSANPGGRHALYRFNEESLLQFFRQFREFKEVIPIKGGREHMGIFVSNSW